MANAAIRIDRDFLACAPKLRVIGSPSTGTDHMDLTSIRAAGIDVFDIATEYELINNFSATAEHAFALTLAVARHLRAAASAGERGDWARERLTGMQLLGKTLGILGLGRLGRISARIGMGFGMRVIANDIEPVPMDGVEMVDFNSLLAQSDILHLHVHLTEATRGIIDDDAFARMKTGAIVINTSRGAVIDETALLHALREGQIAGAGLDVIDGEWLPAEQLRDHPLITYAREHDNLIVTPHMASATPETLFGARIFMARKLAAYIRQQTGAKQGTQP